MAEGVATGIPNPTSAWLPTLLQLRERVFSRLRDSERVFVTESEVDHYINEAYMDLNARLRLNRTSVDGTSSTTGTITYPSDLVEVEALWFDDTPVQFVNDETFNSYALTGVEPFTYIARAVGSTISTYPALISLAYTLEYVARPTMLTVDADQPTVLTPELAMRLPWYAIAEAKWKESEPVEAERYMQQYVEGLPGRPRMAHRMRPAPVTLNVEPGPFDYA